MEQLFKALLDVLKSLGENHQAAEAVVLAAWGRCAGDSLRSRTRALEYFEKRLVVAVEDEMWRQQMEDLSPKLIARLNGTLGQGTVRFIEFRVAPSVIVRNRKQSKAAGSAKMIDQTVGEAAGGIADEALRQRFIDAAAACLDR